MEKEKEKETERGRMEVQRETADYAVIYKLPGEDSERDMPEGLYCVHRLDRAASGLLVYGKSREAAAALSGQLKSRTLRKSYLIAVDGVPSEQEGELTDFLYQDREKQKMFPVRRKRAGVKEARLRYRVLAVEEGRALIRVELETGRFHQIRAQFAARGLPLSGDAKYGSRRKGMLALFCDRLCFLDPRSGEEIMAELPLPEAFPWKRREDVR